MKSSECCKVIYTSFSKKTSLTLNEHISRLNSSTTIDETLNHLEFIFLKIKSLLMTTEDLVTPNLEMGLSHVKVNYVNQEIKQGELVFEIIYFTGDKSTGLHTHPEFIIDEIVQGSIEEINYKLTDDGNYKYCGRVIRKEKDFRTIHNVCGMPHDVCAKDSPCISYSLSLGRRCVEIIPSEKTVKGD